MADHAIGKTLLLAALASLGAAACTTETPESASASSAGGPQCFLANQVSGYVADDEDTAYVTVGANRVYRFDLIGCPDIDWSLAVALRTRGAGSFICSGNDAELIVPSPAGARRCPVTNITRLTDPEARAWRERRPRRNY